MEGREIVLVLHNIRSVHNVGSIFRTADAAGVKKIYLCGITPTPLDRFGHIRADFHKVALGAEKTVAWVKCRTTGKLLKQLKGDGYKIFAIEQHKNSVPYHKLRKPFDGAQGKNKLALIFGNEVKGLPPSVLKKCDKILEIPMRGKKESLNVSVACGIMLFSFVYFGK